MEGAEELVLQGAKKCLMEFRPKIIFEVNPAMARGLGLSPDGAWKLLERWGYQFHTCTATGFLEVCKTFPAGGNVIAMPKEQR